MIASFNDIAALGLNFLLMMICTYTMYVGAADSGMRAALKSELYIGSMNKFAAQKKYITDTNVHAHLFEFCRHYIEQELESSRKAVLATVGISYEQYIGMYLGKDDNAIDKEETLSKTARKAVKKANSIKPVHLTPEMIMRRGKGGTRRAPLGMRPEDKKTIAYSVKFITTLFASIFLSVIVLEAITDPSWVTFATCVVRLLMVVINAFAGYKFGYENIIFDTVEYMDAQTDLMEQAKTYCQDKE